MTTEQTQHARDSAELRRLCSERDQLREKVAELEGGSAALRLVRDDYKRQADEYRAKWSALSVGAVAMPEREAVIMKAVGMCNRIPGSTNWNAAEFAYDEFVARLNPSRGVPEGWVLMPKKLTAEMRSEWDRSYGGWDAIYQVLVSAAPTPAPVEPAHSDVSVPVPRKLLQTIEQSWRIPNGCPKSVSEEVGEIIANGLQQLRALLNGGRDE